MPLDDLKKVWDDWAREDPLWAILSVPSKTHGRWDIEEFFATGKVEIDLLLQDVAKLDISVPRGRCLDFGCGVGRLTQSLADHFERCDGVDISETMINNARRFNKYPDRVSYHVNDNPDLSLFPDSSFDFIYSNIVLQHIEPDVSENYIAEFVRVLTNDGFAVFQVPARFVGPTYPPIADGGHRASIGPIADVLRLVAGERTALRVTVQNVSSVPWAARSALHLGNHWKSADGSTVINFDDGRGQLPVDLPPGEHTMVDLVITSPPTPGRYLLEIDMVEEYVCWFVDRGSAMLTTAVDVAAPAPLPDTGESDHEAGTPPAYAMHALPQSRVMAAVHRQGGHIVAIEPNNAAGEGWESYRYVVGKGSITPGT